MGLFGKKDPCPICGEEVKGLFLVKIDGKQTLCKDCSQQVSTTSSAMRTTRWSFPLISLRAMSCTA